MNTKEYYRILHIITNKSADLLNPCYPKQPSLYKSTFHLQLNFTLPPELRYPKRSLFAATRRRRFVHTLKRTLRGAYTVAKWTQRAGERNERSYTRAC